MKKNDKYLGSVARIFPYIYIAVVLICAVFTLRESLLAGCVLFASSIAMLVHHLLERYSMVQKMKRYFEQFSDEALAQSSQLMFNIPDPIAGVKIDGSFAWYNTPFNEAFYRGDFGKKLSDIFPEVSVESIMADKGAHSISVSHNGMEYKIISTIVSETDPDKPALILYFENVTDMNRLKQLSRGVRPVIMNITIDNYGETVAEAGENEQLELTASIDRILVGWVNGHGGLIRKLERDRYVAVLSNDSLNKIEDERFSVLNDLKNINLVAMAPPTLSIGVGLGGETVAESDNYARMALDMALGRGGDQAAVCDGGKFTYFGGTAKEVEKRTRVKARVMATALKEHILSSEKVLIMGHQEADADAVGAAIGLSAAAAHLNRDCRILLNTGDSAVRAIIDTIDRNHYHDGLFINRSQARDYMTENTLLIICDTHRTSLTEMPDLVDAAKHKVLLDHHRRSEGFIDGCELIYHEPAASSTCEMVTEILMYMDGGLNLSTIDATALYSGIVLDTKGFVLKTGSRTFEAAAYLRNAGVDTMKVKQFFRESLEAYRIRTELIQAAKIDGRGVCVSVSFEEVPVSIVAQAADSLLDIEGVKATFVVCRDGDDARISCRSLGEINVQLIAEALGGGGHALAAAAKMKRMFVGNAVSRLNRAIDEYFEKQS